ncbi:MAG: ATP-dependent Clp protease proteolytic subunit [Pseudomonadota bacterium]
MKTARKVRFPGDDTVLRVAFYSMLIAVICALVFDYREMIEQTPVEISLPNNPVLPAFVPPGLDTDEEPDRVSPKVETAQEVLRQPLQIELVTDGVLNVTGMISVGSAKLFEEKTQNIIEYIKVVNLNSPGGSVNDALEISDLIRKNELSTKVASGALCASSCPIVLAGGKERLAGEKAAIGVHQVYSGSREPKSADQALSEGQSVTARITRHLEAMGVDPVLWIHALETPPNKLYYLSVEELEKFKLAVVSPDA